MGQEINSVYSMSSVWAPNLSHSSWERTLFNVLPASPETEPSGDGKQLQEADSYKAPHSPTSSSVHVKENMNKYKLIRVIKKKERKCINLLELVLEMF